ncbi:MAG: prepilin-type N-terminal cleavage/methylation domain-containing protein [Sulfurospirillaceae bacterium]|nr:prepilin-type N-terminal cleavage/methylation domain-containing protein [Sulfurospirillaceae bacterium]
MKRTAFTMVELIFVIVIIGILAAVGIPKLSGMSDGTKKTAEMATISAVSTALETAHGEWSINEGTFTWGNNQPSTALNSAGYPSVLSASGKIFGAVVKGDNLDFTNVANSLTADYNISIFTGPASNATRGVKYDTNAPNSDIAGKPDKNDFWIYASYINPAKVCTLGGQTFLSGDFLLIDMPGTATTNYATVALQCN